MINVFIVYNKENIMFLCVDTSYNCNILEVETGGS